MACLQDHQLFLPFDIFSCWFFFTFWISSRDYFSVSLQFIFVSVFCYVNLTNYWIIVCEILKFLKFLKPSIIISVNESSHVSCRLIGHWHLVLLIMWVYGSIKCLILIGLWWYLCTEGLGALASYLVLLSVLMKFLSRLFFPPSLWSLWFLFHYY